MHIIRTQDLVLKQRIHLRVLLIQTSQIVLKVADVLVMSYCLCIFEMPVYKEEMNKVYVICAVHQ